MRPILDLCSIAVQLSFMAPRALRRTRPQYLSVAAVLCALFCAADGPVSAQGTDGGVIPVRVVNGHLVVLTDLVGLRYTNEASFEISF